MEVLLIMKINKKAIISIALIIIVSCIFTTNVFAIDNPGAWDPHPKIAEGSFLTDAGIILGWIKFVGIIVSVLALTIIGLKYLLSSVEGKAEYKKTMIPYIVGCFMLMATSIIIGIIEDIATG